MLPVMRVPSGDKLPYQIRPLYRREYDCMVELGLFEDERVELLRGNLIAMSPQGPYHSDVVARIAAFFVTVLGDRALVRAHSPLAVSDDSEPEPDVAIVPPGDYSAEHPRRAWLVVEVSDSSLAKDRAIKAEVYAAGDVSEYWIVNLAEGVIEVHRRRRRGRYSRVTVDGLDDTLALEKFPDVRITVGDVLRIGTRRPPRRRGR